jgi:hypothetical protein
MEPGCIETKYLMRTAYTDERTATGRSGIEAEAGHHQHAMEEVVSVVLIKHNYGGWAIQFAWGYVTI